MPRRLPPLRHRGSAAVELLLSVPFIVLFCLFILDFARGFLSAQRGQRAARQVAWMESRREDDGSLPSAPNDDTLLALHYEGRGGAITHTLTKETEGVPVIADVGDALSDVIDALDTVLSAIGGGDEGRIASLVDFLTTSVDMTKASVTQTVSGLRRVAAGSQMTQSHWVALRSWRDSDPSRRIGWWDPFAALSDAIGKLGGD